MAHTGEDCLVCRCYVVSGGAIRRAIADHQLQAVEEVTAVTRAAGGCGSCYDDVRRILSEVWGKPPPRDAADGSGLSASQKRSRIAELLERDAQPLFDRNGLTVQVVDVNGERVLVRFAGRGVGTVAPSFLSLKRYLVVRMSDACGQKMTMIELNVLEGLAKTSKP